MRVCVAVQHLRPRPEVSRLALWRELYLRDHMRFAAERGPSRLSREQALEKRVLALEQQLGLGLAPLDARAAQEKIRWVGLFRGGGGDDDKGG